MAILLSNNAATKLAVDIAATDTIITVDAGTGDRFPAVTGGSGDYFVITLEDSSGNREFVRVDHRVGDVFGDLTYPCQRGYWGSTALSFAAADTTVDLRLPVEALEDKIYYDTFHKANKVVGAVSGNIAMLDANGDLQDAGYNTADLMEYSEVMAIILG